MRIKSISKDGKHPNVSQQMERQQLEISEGIEQGISSWNRGLSKVFIEVTFVRRYFPD
jgi:hypothetical protein